MSSIESFGSPKPKVEAYEAEHGLEVKTPSYAMLFRNNTPYIDLRSSDGARWIQLFQASEVNTNAGRDVTYDISPPAYSIREDGGVEITVSCNREHGTPKHQTWICHEDFIQTFVTSQAQGELHNIRLLGGVHVAPNMFGESMSERHFESVYNPQPSERERRVISAAESTRITTSGMWRPGRRREFLITPLCYGFNQDQPGKHGGPASGEWLMAGMSAPIEELTMIEYAYDAREDGFSLNLTYDSVQRDEETVVSPSLLLHFASDPLQGLKDYSRNARRLGHLEAASAPKIASWHQGSTFVSWGHQVETARNRRLYAVDIENRDLANETFITQSLATLEENHIPIDKLVIDDKWQDQYGTNLPDLEKWPDMAGFIDTQHQLGRHVMLWLKLFDPEGLPPELCILDAHGRPVASDPTNPEYIECLREQIGTMLDPDGLDADGFKLDFLAQLPHGPGLRWHGKQRGHAALHHLMKNINDETKHIKPTALVQAQVVNPWFATTFDQVRLNDTNERHPVVKTMGRRARLAQALLPKHSIDPDGWPLPDLTAWSQYIRAQPGMARTVTTHYVESINGEPMEPRHFQELLQAIEKARRLRESET